MMKLGFTAQEAAAMNDAEIMGNLAAFEEAAKGKVPKKAKVVKNKHPKKHKL